MSGLSATMMWRVRALFLLFSCACAATLTAQQNTGAHLMRRSMEQDEEVQLGASAEMIHIRSKPAPVNFAGQDYIIGVRGVDKCQKADHRYIKDSALCRQAAAVLNISMLPIKAETEKGGYYTHSDHYHEFPRGCYKAPCVFEPGECVFFNQVPDEQFIQNPTEDNATNICARDMFKYGTENSNGTANSTTCPEDYVVIMEEVQCEEAVVELGRAKGIDGLGADFLIGVSNRTEHDRFPQGCFINNATDRGFLNPRRPMLDPANSTNLDKDWIPGSPVGVPICRAGLGVTPDAPPTAAP